MKWECYKRFFSLLWNTYRITKKVKLDRPRYSGFSETYLSSPYNLYSGRYPIVYNLPAVGPLGFTRQIEAATSYAVLEGGRVVTSAATF